MEFSPYIFMDIFFGRWHRKFLKGKICFSEKMRDPGRCIVFLKLKIIFPGESIMSESIELSSIYLNSHAFSLLRKKHSVTLFRIVRQTLLRTTAIGIGTTAMGFYSGFSSKYSTSQQEFKAKE